MNNVYCLRINVVKIWPDQDMLQILLAHHKSGWWWIKILPMTLTFKANSFPVFVSSATKTKANPPGNISNNQCNTCNALWQTIRTIRFILRFDSWTFWDWHVWKQFYLQQSLFSHGVFGRLTPHTGPQNYFRPEFRRCW